MNDNLLKHILHRDETLFLQDMEENYQELAGKIFNSRILVIGAAGSIGASFVKQVIPYRPATLHLVDINENNLVEVVRDLRSLHFKIPEDFRTYAIGLGTAEFEAFLKSHAAGYDYYVNFAALKHVRSERDPYTLMRMLHTNVLSLKHLLDYLTLNPKHKFFSVSSDKAVNPVSIMGATKAFMEKLMILYSDKVPCSSARFANVAFSDGSLLFGFNKRLEKRQAISAPSDVKRYFISHEEAGILCLLSCFLGENCDVYFPKLNKFSDMYSFTEIAKIFLEYNGFKPLLLSSEEEAKKAAERMDKSSKEWPCYFSKSETTGEKLYEEFYTQNDIVDFDTYKKIGVIKEEKLDEARVIALNDSICAIQKLREKRYWSKKDIVESLKMAIPEIQHEEKEKDLDERM